MHLVLSKKLICLLIEVLSTECIVLSGLHYVKLAADLCLRTGLFTFFRGNITDTYVFLYNFHGQQIGNKGQLHLMFESLRLL